MMLRRWLANPVTDAEAMEAFALLCRKRFELRRAAVLC